MTKLIEQYAVELQDCTGFDQLYKATLEFFLEEGVKMVSYHHMPPPGATDYTGSITVLTHGYPEELVELYVTNRYYAIDPIPKRALSSARPFWWSDARNTPGLSKIEIAYLDGLEEADIGDGIAVPLYGPHGRNGYSGLGCGERRKKWPAQKVARLHAAAQLGHGHYCELLFAMAPKNVRLSQRKSEILEWVAKGKSYSVIAEILGISTNTVDTYRRRIFEKLDVTDRVTAALRGLAIGVIG